MGHGIRSISHLRLSQVKRNCRALQLPERRRASVYKWKFSSAPDRQFVGKSRQFVSGISLTFQSVCLIGISLNFEPLQVFENTYPTFRQANCWKLSRGGGL